MEEVPEAETDGSADRGNGADVSLLSLDEEIKAPGAEGMFDMIELDALFPGDEAVDDLTLKETVVARDVAELGDPGEKPQDEKAGEALVQGGDAGSAEDAHYSVNVQHYAHYEKGEGDVYAERTREHLLYASKTPWARFLVDFMNVMVRPVHFWEGQSEHPATLAQIHFPHLVLLVWLRAIAVFVGGVLRQGSDAISELVSAFSQALLIFVFVWLLALIYSGIMAVVAKGFHFSRCLNFVAYAITPLLVINIMSVFPIPHMSMVCDIIALPYVFVVLGAGMLPFLKVPEKTAPILCGLFCGLMACLWSVLPILMPRLISIL